MHLSSSELEQLQELRQIFLSEDPSRRGAYWRSAKQLRLYDRTLGQRIAWKWDAVLMELQRRGWSPPPGLTLLDWGCGSGIASRRVLARFGSESIQSVQLLDRSPLAVEVAREEIQGEFPDVPIEDAADTESDDAQPTLLLISHVWNELRPSGRRKLLQAVSKSSATIWVEPGTHAASRGLLEAREQLREEFRVIAPCTHAEVCGLTLAGNEKHWCHFFAQPSEEVFQDSAWMAFARQLKIDMRSTPYSFLVLESLGVSSTKKDPWHQAHRVLGRPKHHKGYSELYGCSVDGVSKLRVLARCNKELIRELRRDETTVYRMEIRGDEIDRAVSL